MKRSSKLILACISALLLGSGLWGCQSRQKPQPPYVPDGTGDASLLECPKVRGREGDFFITHRVNNGTRVNYSLEYDIRLHHALWVCFSFDNYTKQTNVKRTNAWAWDPFIPAQYEVNSSSFKGYDRGHLVASHDRVFSEEANRQTFYYSNMSPQKAAFNQVAWRQLEEVVQKWARNEVLTDKMYVAKGGTLTPEGIYPTLSGGKIAVPRNYWMAILAEKNGEWRALGFWISHESSKQLKVGLAPLACSIDELESKTDFDFFPNLEDNIEQKVEAIDPKDCSDLWPGL